VVASLVLIGPSVPIALGQARLSVPSQRGYPATMVIIPVSFKAWTNVVALQADISYGANGLTSLAAAPGAAATNALLLSSEPSVGVRRLLLYSPAGNVLGQGAVAEVPFVVPPDVYAGFYRLTLTNVVLATAAAQPVISTNLSGLIALTPVFLSADGSVDFFLNVTADQTYLVQASTNLVDWLTLSTNIAVGPYLEFTEPGAGLLYPHRFYRALPTEP